MSLGLGVEEVSLSRLGGILFLYLFILPYFICISFLLLVFFSTHLTSESAKIENEENKGEEGLG